MVSAQIVPYKTLILVGEITLGVGGGSVKSTVNGILQCTFQVIW